MTQQRRTAQRAEIVPSGLNSDRDIVSGPATSRLANRRNDHD